MNLSLLIFVFLCFPVTRTHAIDVLPLAHELTLFSPCPRSSLSHASCFAFTPSLFSNLSTPFDFSVLLSSVTPALVSDVMMVCCSRALDSPCTLALLVGFQFAFVLYFSLGGFRGLVSVLVHSTEPEIDYSRPHDVYTNLTSLLVHHPGPSGPEQQIRDCTLPSPLLGRYKAINNWICSFTLFHCSF